MVLIMKQVIILLISLFFTLNNSFADGIKDYTDENAAANVLNNYYQEFEKNETCEKKYSIDPDIFLIDTNLSNYYAEHLTHTAQKRP